MGYLDGITNPKIGPDRISPEAQQWRTLRGGPPNMGSQLPPDARLRPPTAGPAMPPPAGSAPVPPAGPAAAAEPVSRLRQVGRAATAPFRAAGAGANTLLHGDLVTGAKALAQSPALRAAGAVGAGYTGAKLLHDAATGDLTPTEDYRAAMGITEEHRQNNRDLLGKIGIGENAADLLNDLAVRTFGVLGESFVPGFNPRGAAARAAVPAAAPAAQPAAATGGRMPLPAGVTPSAAGAGRGSPLHPLRTDVDPTDPRFGAARDFSRELATVPKALPDDLRSGVVFKTKDANGRTVYSGRDVKADAQIVDGLGRSTGQLGNTSLDTSAGYRADLAELSRLRAERAGREASFAVNQPGGGLGGFSPRTLVDDVVAKAGRRSAADEAGLSPRQRANLRMQEADLAQRGSIAAAQTAATLRGQDIGAATSRYGVDTSSATIRRGQDMDYAEKIDARMLQLAAQEAQRRRIAAAWQGTDDPAVAARRLAANGMDPASALSIASDARAAAEAAAKDVERLVEPLSVVVDKNGVPQVSQGLVAQNRKLLRGAVPGLATASPEERIRRQPLALGTVQAVQGLNELRGDNTIDQILGRLPPERTTLPDLAGAEVAPLGFTDVLPWSKRSVGDTRLRLRDGTDLYIPRARVNEDTLGALRAAGARIKE